MLESRLVLEQEDRHARCQPKVAFDQATTVRRVHRVETVGVGEHPGKCLRLWHQRNAWTVQPSILPQEEHRVEGNLLRLCGRSQRTHESKMLARSRPKPGREGEWTGGHLVPF